MCFSFTSECASIFAQWMDTHSSVFMWDLYIGIHQNLQKIRKKSLPFFQIISAISQRLICYLGWFVVLVEPFLPPRGCKVDTEGGQTHSSSCSLFVRMDALLSPGCDSPHCPRAQRALCFQTHWQLGHRGAQRTRRLHCELCSWKQANRVLLRQRMWLLGEGGWSLPRWS